jgi:hypothetical protein
VALVVKSDNCQIWLTNLSDLQLAPPSGESYFRMNNYMFIAQ